MNFHQWLEAIERLDDVEWWSKYARTRRFSSEQEAREWVFRVLQHQDKQTWARIFGKRGEEANRQEAQKIPVYLRGNSWKIGKPIRSPDTRLRLGKLEIRPPSSTELHTIAQSNGLGNYRFLVTRNYPLRQLLSEPDYLYQRGGERERIAELAQEIKRNRWFEPIVIDADEMEIIEGQHRARAIKELGFQTVPAIAIDYESRYGR